MIAIIDYDTGNTKSVSKALTYLGMENEITADADKIISADGVILPGVGAFKIAMAEIKCRNLIDPINQVVANHTPLLGICLGMQLLFETGYEFGVTKGLGLIPGKVVPIPQQPGFKIPHVGWDDNRLVKPDPIGAEFENQFTYFVHSYYVDTPAENIVAINDYGKVQIPSVVRQENVIGIQFHPEKSSRVGLNGLAKFKEVVDNASNSSN